MLNITSCDIHLNFMCLGFFPSVKLNTASSNTRLKITSGAFLQCHVKKHFRRPSPQNYTCRAFPQCRIKHNLKKHSPQTCKRRAFPQCVDGHVASDDTNGQTLFRNHQTDSACPFLAPCACEHGTQCSWPSRRLLSSQGRGSWSSSKTHATNKYHHQQNPCNTSITPTSTHATNQYHQYQHTQQTNIKAHQYHSQPNTHTHTHTHSAFLLKPTDTILNPPTHTHTHTLSLLKPTDIILNHHTHTQTLSLFIKAHRYHSEPPTPTTPHTPTHSAF